MTPETRSDPEHFEDTSLVSSSSSLDHLLDLLIGSNTWLLFNFCSIDLHLSRRVPSRAHL